MGNFVDLSGRKIGRLIVMSRDSVRFQPVRGAIRGVWARLRHLGPRMTEKCTIWAAEADKLYRERGGEHPAVAIFYDSDVKESWEVMVGNGNCPVRLGEVEGEVCGAGVTLEEAFSSVMVELQKWSPAPPFQNWQVEKLKGIAKDPEVSFDARESAARQLAEWAAQPGRTQAEVDAMNAGAKNGY